ncbi:MAG: chlorite dismutase family protein [Myxococcota bacterium]|nr:chlorite dismutase family protein [Myxococcota bacterium]
MDLSEVGLSADGSPETLDRRLFVQLQVFDIEPASGPRAMVSALTRRLDERRISAVVYEDVNDHRGIGLLTWAEDPSHLVDEVRSLLGGKRFNALTPRPGWNMFGRTYATGHEQGLSHWLLERPKQNILNTDNRWAVWYPLRRKGEFGRLDDRTKGGILREHGSLGRAYGEAGLVQDIRLACFGLDTEDNDFVIGLVAAGLHPISHVVQAMRSTEQTATYIEKMGPFFVGRKVWQNPSEWKDPAAEEAASEDPVTEAPAQEEPPAKEAGAPEAAQTGEEAAVEPSDTVDDFVPIDEDIADETKD